MKSAKVIASSDNTSSKRSEQRPKQQTVVVIVFQLSQFPLQILQSVEVKKADENSVNKAERATELEGNVKAFFHFSGEFGYGTTDCECGQNLFLIKSKVEIAYRSKKVRR